MITNIHFHLPVFTVATFSIFFLQFKIFSLFGGKQVKFRGKKLFWDWKLAGMSSGFVAEESQMCYVGGMTEKKSLI